MTSSSSNACSPLSNLPSRQDSSSSVHSRIKTPCIGVCSTGIGDDVCRGCKRFSHEVIGWNAYSEEEKRIVDNRLREFLSICMQNKFIVTDKQLLTRQIAMQQVPHNLRHDEYGVLYALLKAGASQIKSPEKYGFSVCSRWRGQRLRTLLEIVDHEFLELSTAHYERYFIVHALPST